VNFFFAHIHRMLARFPFFAQPAHSFPQAHRQRRDRFESLFPVAGDFAVFFPANLHQQQLRVPQNSRQGIVQLVSQHFPKILFALAGPSRGETSGL